MAKIGLSEGFSLIPKGIHVFKIVEVNYKEDFGKMEVVMQIASGQKHTEKFSLLNKNGELNQGAMSAFSYFAKTALNDFNRDEIDDQDLVGCYIRCNVDYEEMESNRTQGKIVKFVRLGDKSPADGFDAEPTQAALTMSPTNSGKPTASASAAKTGGLDLDSLLE
jgi:hypothetical protein